MSYHGFILIYRNLQEVYKGKWRLLQNSVECFTSLGASGEEVVAGIDSFSSLDCVDATCSTPAAYTVPRYQGGEIDRGKGPGGEDEIAKGKQREGHRGRNNQRESTRGPGSQGKG